jgi:voltage-gated potassium channel
MIAFLLLYWQFVRIVWAVGRDPRVRPVAAWMATLLVIGPVFYHVVEGWGWIDSIYFSVMTLGTVGYGDLSPSTPASKIFTIAYLLLGIGILVAFANAVVERATERPVEHRPLPRLDADRDDAAPAS